MQKEKLLAQNYTCVTCNQLCPLWKKANTPLGRMFTCRVNRCHTKSILSTLSFFGTRIEIRDLLLFIYNYLDGLPQYKCREKAGIGSCHTEVDWSSFIRDTFLEDMYIIINSEFQFEGDIELNESLFGDRKSMAVEAKR